MNRIKALYFQIPQRMRPILAIFTIAVIGTALTLFSFAGSTFVDLEAEDGDVSGPTCQISDTGASGGSAVQFGECPDVQLASSVTQYGITWTFSEQKEVGQFANGDWWVKGPVTITSITPDYNGSRHGWEVNPTGPLGQGFDDRIAYFESDRVPTLPYNAEGGDSIVKSISNFEGSGGCIDAPNHTCKLDTAAVLTVLDGVPANNGATVFRPAYAGDVKTLYSVNDIRTDLLPSLAPTANAVTLDSVEDRFQRVQLDHMSSWQTRYMHPEQNMPMYGADVARGIIDGGLRLLLNDSVEDKMPALINYMQHGIDLHGMMNSGSDWHADGGHFVGRKLPLVFTAVMLNDAQMKADISSAPSTQFSEDDHTYYGQNGVALFGKAISSEKEWWDRVYRNTGKRDAADPYGYIDGGSAEIGGAYQYCCTTQVYKAEVLVARLLPGGKEIWNHDALFDYIDRWVTFGVWASPDPCSLQEPSPYTGSCIAGSGRFTDKHGDSADEGAYRSPFADSMWDAYR